MNLLDVAVEYLPRRGSRGFREDAVSRHGLPDLDKGLVLASLPKQKISESPSHPRVIRRKLLRLSQSSLGPADIFRLFAGPAQREPKRVIVRRKSRSRFKLVESSLLIAGQERFLEQLSQPIMRMRIVRGEIDT